MKWPRLANVKTSATPTRPRKNSDASIPRYRGALCNGVLSALDSFVNRVRFDMGSAHAETGEPRWNFRPVRGNFGLFRQSYIA